MSSKIFIIFIVCDCDSWSTTALIGTLDFLIMTVLVSILTVPAASTFDLGLKNYLASVSTFDCQA